MSWNRNVLGFCWHWSFWTVSRWRNGSVSISHSVQTRRLIIRLSWITLVPAPLCSLWAAGWAVSVHSLFSQDREAGRGCLCTPRRPSSLCPGSVCWEGVPSACSLLTDSQTAERGPWRALAPDLFPEEKKHAQAKQQLHNNGFTFSVSFTKRETESCRHAPSAKTWPFSSPSHLCLPFWRSPPAAKTKQDKAHSQTIACGFWKDKTYTSECIAFQMV